MAYSYIEYTAAGSSTFNIPFGYIDQSEISVYVDGVSATFTFTTASTVNVTPTPASGALVRVERNTDLTSRVVDFASGSVLTEEDMDNSNIQVFNAAQEAIDKANASIALDVDGKYDASSAGTNRVIKNVADPVDANDAVNKSWAESGMTSQLSIATTQASTATSAATAASTSATNAAGSASSASTSASGASTSATNAANSATAAASSASSAASSATAAASSQSAAATSASNASTSATTASTAATNATAQASAAANSATNAAASESSALTSKNAAATSATNAASSATNAATSATSAGNSATNAQTSATNAASSATSASTSAASALSSKNAAASSETNAATSATNAASSATAAAASAASVAGTESAVTAIYDNFDDRYLGAKASAPSTDNDGDALVVGALYFDTTSDTMKVYSSGGWTAAGSSVNGTANRYDYVVGTASGSYDGSSNTTFPATYDAGYVDVWLNGAKLVPTTDFTATSGTQIVLTSAASAGANVCIVGYGTFSLANFSVGDANDVDLSGISDGDALLYNSTSGNFEAGPVDALPSQSGNSGKYLTTDGSTASWGTVDLSTKVSKTGDTMTGDLDVTGDVTATNLGAGTTSPSYKIHSYQGGSGGVVVGAYLAATGNGGSGRGTGLLFGSPGSGNVVDTARIDALQNAQSSTADSAALVVNVANTSGTLTERMRIDSSGRVTMPYQPISHGRLAATLNGGSGDTLKFATVSVNNGGHYNTSTGIFTCPVSGYYQAHIAALPNPGGTSSTYISLNLYKNGVSTAGTTGYAYIAPANEHEFGVTVIVYASANDTLKWVMGGNNTISLYGGETSGGFQLIG
jgi:hypothetical protein